MAPDDEGAGAGAGAGEGGAPPGDENTDDAPPARSAITNGGEEPPAGEEGEEGTDKEPSGKPEFSPLLPTDLEIPEGVDAESEHFSSFLEIMNNQELDAKGRGSALLSLLSTVFDDSAEAATAAVQEAWDKRKDDWQAQLTADPKFGGVNLKANLSSIKQGLETVVNSQFFTSDRPTPQQQAEAEAARKAVFDALDETGAGDHPALVKLFHALVQPFVEKPPPGGDPSRGRSSLADRIYGGNS